MADRLSAAAERLLRRLDRLEPALRREVARAFVRLRRRLTEAQILKAIESGDPFSLRALTSAFSRDLQEAAHLLTSAVQSGARSAASQVPALTTTFTISNPLATRAAERAAAQFVTRVSDETRKAIRAVISDSFKNQISTVDTAKRIRGLVGLTERQAKAVLAREAANVARGLVASKVKALTKQYTEQLIRKRAEMIARTELAMVSTEGQIAAWKDAKAQGLIGADMRQTWIVTPDDKLCPICEPLDGETAPIGGLFQTPDGPVAGPPAHPNCRCALGLKRVTQRVGRVA